MGEEGASYLLFELQEYLMARSSVGACLELKFYRLLSTPTPIFEPPALRFACCYVVRVFTASRRFTRHRLVFDSFSLYFNPSRALLALDQRSPSILTS